MKIKKVVSYILVFVMFFSLCSTSYASSEKTILTLEIQRVCSDIKNGKQVEISKEMMDSIFQQSGVNDENLKKEANNVKVEKIKEKDNKVIVKSESGKEKLFMLGIKESFEIPDDIPEINGEEIEVYTDNEKNLTKALDESDDILVENINFAIFDSEEKAQEEFDNYNISQEKETVSTNAVAINPPSIKPNPSSFWHGSSIGLYYSSANGYYYKINLTSVDVNYLLTVLWIAVGAIVAIICLFLPVVGCAIAILIGAVIVVSAYSYYWKYQNPNGSLDIYIYWNMVPSWARQVGLSSYTITKGTYLGKHRIGGSSNYGYYNCYYNGPTKSYSLN